MSEHIEFIKLNKGKKTWWLIGRVNTVGPNNHKFVEFYCDDAIVSWIFGSDRGKQFPTEEAARVAWIATILAQGVPV